MLLKSPIIDHGPTYDKTIFSITSQNRFFFAFFFCGGGGGVGVGGPILQTTSKANLVD